MPTLCCFIFSLSLTGKVASDSISLDLPVDVVSDSPKAYVTVLGKQLEILGSTRNNGARGCQVAWQGGTCAPRQGKVWLEVKKGEKLILYRGQ